MAQSVYMITKLIMPWAAEGGTVESDEPLRVTAQER